MSTPEFKTKKAAKAAGLRTQLKWSKRQQKADGGYRPPVIPRKSAVPIVVKGEEFFRFEDCEELVSRPEARRRGLSVPRNAHPAGLARYPVRMTGVAEYDLFRLSDCVPKRKVRQTPPTEVDILLAVFTVNRAAKRYRDAAQTHYRGRRHGLAQHAKRVKGTLYELKEDGIRFAYGEGRLQFVGPHANLAVYRGEGYCFHSCLVPEDVPMPKGEELQEDALFVESAPRGTGEARLKDATSTLKGIYLDQMVFKRLPRPEFSRETLPADVEEWREDREYEEECEEDDWDECQAMELAKQVTRSE